MYSTLTILTIGGWLMFITLFLSLLDIPYKKHFRMKGWIITTALLFIFSYYAWFNEQSIVQSSIAIISGLYSIFIIYLMYKNNIGLRQTTIFITLSSGILLLLYTISTIQLSLISSVATETQFFLDMLGYDTAIERSNDGMYIRFLGTNLKTEIVMACTGIGSIALFAGFISSIDTLSIQMKLALISISSGAIYILNIIRNVFIAGAYGGQWFHIQPEIIESVFGRGDEWVSFYIADRIISQIGAVLVMIIFAIGIINIIDDKTKLIQEWMIIIEHTEKSINNILD
jgi:archaeosortase A (PGF-CTERM-specific)